VPAVLIPEVSDEEVQLFAFRVAVCANKLQRQFQRQLINMDDMWSNGEKGGGKALNTA